MATQWILPLTKGQKKTQMTLSKKRKQTPLLPRNPRCEYFERPELRTKMCFHGFQCPTLPQEYHR